MIIDKLNQDEVRTMGLIPLMETLGLIKKVRDGTEPLYETQHLHPLNIQFCRPRSKRMFDRRIERFDAEGHVLSSSAWTDQPQGKKRQNNRRRNRVAKLARRRNRR